MMWRMHKILVISITRMGDLFQSIPFLRRLKLRPPGSELHLLVEKCFEDVAICLPGVDRVHTVDMEKLLPALSSSTSQNLPQALRDYRSYTDMLRAIRADEVWNLTHTKPATILNNMLAGEHG